MSAVTPEEYDYHTGEIYTVNSVYSGPGVSGWEGQQVVIPFDQSQFQRYVSVYVPEGGPELYPEPLPDRQALFKPEELTPYATD